MLGVKEWAEAHMGEVLASREQYDTPGVTTTGS